MNTNLNNRSHFAGLSLLEVFLSLIILSFLLLSFISFEENMKRRNIVKTAKIQINTLLDAAIQYYTTYAQWPSSLKALSPFLIGNSTQNLNFCSPWFSDTGCQFYTIAANSTYFALKVITTGSRDAQDLIAVLPNAYLDSDGHSVIAYTNAALQQSLNNTPPIPMGILYASGANYWSGSLSTASYSDKCFVSSTNANGPYGLIDVMNTPQSINSCQTSGNTTLQYTPPLNCPSGSTSGVLLLPIGTPPSLNDSNAFGYLYYLYNNSYPSPPTPGTALSFSNFLGYTNASLILSFTDLVCLDPSTMNWAPYAHAQ